MLPQFFEFWNVCGFLVEQSFLDHFDRVGAVEFEFDREAALDLGKIVALALVLVTDDRVEVLLGRDDDPCAAVGLHAQVFGDGLQVEHALCAVADELAHLIDHEEDTMVRGLAAKPVDDIIGERVDACGEALFVSSDDVMLGNGA